MRLSPGHRRDEATDVQAIILAAGVGMRLRDRRSRPKCLRVVGGATLVEHQLAILAGVGVTDVTLVVGHAEKEIRARLGSRVRYVVNKAFEDTNSLYSFLLAAQEAQDDVIVMNCDVFFHPDLLSRLVMADGDALLYDSESGDEDEHMKVRISGGHLVEMSKVLPGYQVHGENVGVIRLSRQAVKDAAAAARQIVATGGRRAWLAAAINEVAGVHPIECLDVAGRPWVEIDFPEDLLRARTEVLPALTPALDRLAGYRHPVTVGNTW